jgi:hypothetical protein
MKALGFSPCAAAAALLACMTKAAAVAVFTLNRQIASSYLPKRLEMHKKSIFSLMAVDFFLLRSL